MSNDDLAPLPVSRKQGGERFTRAGTSLSATLLDFWQWARSDLLGNTDRGVLAEYLVAMDLGVAEGVREGWAAYDLRTADGIKVEVKSSAYVQSWKQKRLSRITFSIPPTHAWDPETDVFDEKKRRQADIYVFAVLANRDQATIDPLDVAQWEFYVLRTSVLDERLKERKSVTLDTLIRLGANKVGFGQIGAMIAQVAAADT